MKRNYIYNIYVCFKELFLKSILKKQLHFFRKIKYIFIFLMKTNLITTGKQFKSIVNTYLLYEICKFD